MELNPWLADAPIAPKCPTCDVRLLDGRCLDCGPPAAEQKESPTKRKKERVQYVQMDLFGNPVADSVIAEQFAAIERGRGATLEELVQSGEVVYARAPVAVPTPEPVAAGGSVELPNVDVTLEALGFFELF